MPILNWLALHSQRLSSFHQVNIKLEAVAQAAGKQTAFTLHSNQISDHSLPAFSVREDRPPCDGMFSRLIFFIIAGYQRPSRDLPSLPASF